MWFSLLIIVILFTFHCSSFSTTFCHCSDPNQILQFADSTCKPEPRSHKFNEVNYKIYTIQPETIKFPGYICGRWQQIKRITMNSVVAKITTPYKMHMPRCSFARRIQPYFLKNLKISRSTRKFHLKLNQAPPVSKRTPRHIWWAVLYFR